MYEEFKFDYARTSLRYLIRTYEIKEIFIPYYLCDVIRHSVFAENCKPLFYHIDDNFMPDREFPKEAYILYPNYFGVFDNNVETLVNIYPKLIVDNAHSFYSPPKGFACFNSERKFRPVKDGSYLWIKKEDAPQKAGHPMIWSANENVIKYICGKYNKTNLLKINPQNAFSPFCYPYLASTEREADELARELEQKGKIIYRYWNPLPKTFNEYKFYRRLVPIPLN